MSSSILIICNAIDEKTRAERGITTDSPAASRKVFMMAKALLRSGSRATVLSMARGSASGKPDWHPTSHLSHAGISTIYAPFTNSRVFSSIVSMFGLLILLARISAKDRPIVVFYNRHPAYILSLVLARILRLKTFLDLEDGEVGADGYGRISAYARLFDFLCRDGAVIACKALEEATNIKPTATYYGVSEPLEQRPPDFSTFLTVLMSGSLSPETGADFLAATIRELRIRQPAWASKISFEITGSGPSTAQLKALADQSANPAVTFHGRLPLDTYKSLLARSQLGLSLKLPDGPYAHTTFPSKVIEYASSGLLVVSFDISDVRSILKDGAIYLQAASPDHLITTLEFAFEHAAKVQEMATTGRRNAAAICSERTAGACLRNFLEGQHVG